MGYVFGFFQTRMAATSATPSVARLGFLVAPATATMATTLETRVPTPTATVEAPPTAGNYFLTAS